MSHAIQQEFNAGRASSSMIADTIHHAPLVLTPVREIQERSRTYQGHDFERNDGVRGRIWNIKPLPRSRPSHGRMGSREGRRIQDDEKVRHYTHSC